MQNEHQHEFETTKRDGSRGDTYILIFCKKCGFVSFDQSKQGIDSDYQKKLREKYTE